MLAVCTAERWTASVSTYTQRHRLATQCSCRALDPQHFHSHSTPPLSYTMLMQSVGPPAFPLTLNATAQLHNAHAERWTPSISTHTQRHHSATQCSCRAFADDHRILCHEHEMLLKLNFIQLVE